MARPDKSGIDYYPRDIGLQDDRKFRRCRLKYGWLAVAVYELLLDMIYSDKGYYIKYDNADIADVVWEIMTGLQGPGQPEHSETITDIITALVDADLFDRDKLDNQGVLTSRRIQETYYKATQERKYVKVEKTIWMLDAEEMQGLSSRSSILQFFNQANNSVNPPNNPVNRASGTQSKVKESKGNENTAPDTAQSAAPDTEKIFLSLPLNTGDVWPVTETMIDNWSRLYPAVNVRNEVRKMYGWLDAHPKNRKTPTGVLAYIQRWLGKAQDAASVVQAERPARRMEEFH